MAAGIASIIQYSEDYQKRMCKNGETYFSIQIDYDFAMSIPDMEKRVYYKKETSDEMKKRLNRIGIWLLFKYNIETQEIRTVTVKFDVGCMTEYHRQQDIEKIVDMVIRERGKCNG